MDSLRAFPSPSPDPERSYEASRQKLRQDPDFDKVFAAVSDELKKIAHTLRGRERYCTMSTGEIVSEAYLKMVAAVVPDLHDKAKFKIMAAIVMREILIGAARRRGARKRGGKLVRVTLNDELGLGTTWDEKLVDLDRRLHELGEADTRAAEAIDMHFFGGCTVAEIAKHQKLSPSTVARDLREALAWLELTTEPESAAPLRKSA